MSSASKDSLLLKFACRKHTMDWASVTGVVCFRGIFVLPKQLSAGSVISNLSTSIMSDVLIFSIMSWAIRSPAWILQSTLWLIIITFVLPV